MISINKWYEKILPLSKITKTDITRESRNKNYIPQDKTFEDLISLLKVKQEEKRRAYDEYQAVVTERDMYKKQVDEYVKMNKCSFCTKLL